jgi:hypothetical protein
MSKHFLIKTPKNAQKVLFESTRKKSSEFFAGEIFYFKVSNLLLRQQFLHGKNG